MIISRFPRSKWQIWFPSLTWLCTCAHTEHCPQPGALPVPSRPHSCPAQLHPFPFQTTPQVPGHPELLSKLDWASFGLHQPLSWSSSSWEDLICVSLGLKDEQEALLNGVWPCGSGYPCDSMCPLAYRTELGLRREEEGSGRGVSNFHLFSCINPANI